MTWGVRSSNNITNNLTLVKFWRLLILIPSFSLFSICKSFAPIISLDGHWSPRLCSAMAGHAIQPTNFKPTAAKKSGQIEIFQALILNLNQTSWSQQFNEKYSIHKSLQCLVLVRFLSNIPVLRFLKTNIARGTTDPGY